MQSGHYRHDNQGQAGLEVVPQHGQPWLEVRQDHYDESKELAIPKYPDTYHGAQASPQSAHQYPYPHPYPDTPVVIPNAPAGSDPNAQADRKRRRRIIIGVVLVIVVVIIAAVLGGVLGSRASRSGADSSSGSAGSSEGQNGSGSGSNSGSSNSTSPSRPKTVRQGTALTIGGWRKPTGDVELWLFYQDPEGGLRYSRCNSTSRLVEGQKSCWGPPTSFFSNAKAPAQLGVGFLVFSARHSPQVELFYSGPSNRLLGTNFNDLSTPSVAEDSVNMVGITTGTNSSLSSYWPWTIFQDPAGGIIHVRNDVVGPQKSPASVWSVSATNITAAAGSKFALVPMSTNFSAIAEKAGYAVFYQTLDGKLGVNIPDLNSPQRDANYSQSWPTEIPSITLPRLAPIAAFSVARRDDTRQQVDTYVLYPDSSFNINMLYTDLSSGSPVWKTTQPAALKGIDKDSNIACLTFSTTLASSIGSPILLEAASEEMKCFFQREGKIVEAKLVGEDWVVTGNVPIP